MVAEAFTTASPEDSVSGTAVEINNSAPRRKPAFACTIKVDAKIRYNSKSSSAIIKKKKEELEIRFSEPQLAITPGQSVVFYNEDEVIGGAIIK